GPAPDVEWDASKFQGESLALRAEHRVLGPRIELRLRLAVAIGDPDASWVEVEGPVDMADVLDMGVPARQEPPGPFRQHPPQLLLRRQRQDDVVEGLGRAVKAQQRTTLLEIDVDRRLEPADHFT